MKEYYQLLLKRLQDWSAKRILNLFIFNTILTLLLLLRSAGYFSPFLSLTISFIVILCLVLAVLLLGARSKSLFIITLIFWLFTTFLKVLKIDIWAERAAIYSFEALIVGLFVFLIEKNQSHHD